MRVWWGAAKPTWDPFDTCNADNAPYVTSPTSTRPLPSSAGDDVTTDPMLEVQSWLAMALNATTDSPAPAYTLPAASTAGQPEMPPSPSTDHTKAPDVWLSAYKPPPWELAGRSGRNITHNKKQRARTMTNTKFTKGEQTATLGLRGGGWVGRRGSHCADLPEHQGPVWGNDRGRKLPVRASAVVELLRPQHVPHEYVQGPDAASVCGEVHCSHSTHCG